MNLAPVQIEHAHGHRARGLVYIAYKLDRADSVSRVREHLTDNARRSVKELDAKLQGQSRAFLPKPMRLLSAGSGMSLAPSRRKR
jgi:hypothetical protein